MEYVEQYKKFVLRNALGGQRGLFKRAMYFHIEAGELANEAKKLEEKDRGVISEERYGKLVEELGDSLYYLFLVMDSLKLTLPELMEANIQKLEARYAKRADWRRDIDASRGYSPVPDMPSTDHI